MTPPKDERPKAVSGTTQRISTGYGNLYVTVNAIDGDVFEVFLARGSSGGFEQSYLESLGKTLSNALRSGSDPEELARDLVGIRSPKAGADNGDDIYSVPDAVGIAMLRFIHDEQGESIRTDGAEVTV